MYGNGTKGKRGNAKGGFGGPGPGRGRGRRRGSRRIGSFPSGIRYHPIGVPMKEIESIDIGLDELEAMRLCDRLGLTQEEAASRMGVSRRTLWTDLKSGRKKLITAIIEGKGINLIGLESSRFLPDDPKEE